jgi:hypothetical protein
MTHRRNVDGGEPRGDERSSAKAPERHAAIVAQRERERAVAAIAEQGDSPGNAGKLTFGCSGEGDLVHVGREQGHRGDMAGEVRPFAREIEQSGDHRPIAH